MARKKIESVYVLPPDGTCWKRITDAIDFIAAVEEVRACASCIRYEVGIRYTNGDEVRGQFKDKLTAIAFLREMK